MALNLEVNILGEFKNLTKATKGATKQLQGLQSSARSIARGINGAFATIGVGLSLNALSGAIRGAVSEASTLEESVNAVRVAFGPAAEEVLKLGENSAKSFGLARSEFNSAAVRFSAFATVIAKDGETAAGVVEQLTTRAADFASVFNIEVDEALRVFQSGLAGESEPLRRFGVILTDTEVKAFAYANRIAEVGKELTATQKTQARYGLLLRETNKVQGDFANTSGSMANALRIMRAGFQDASASIGNGFTPAIAASAQFISDNIQVFDNLGEAIGTRLRAAFENTSGSATSFGAAIITTLTDLTAFLNGTAEADNTFVKLQETFGPFLELLGAFGELTKGVITVLNGVVDGLFGWINLIPGLEGSVSGFAGFVRFLGEVLQNVGHALGFIISLFIPFTAGFQLALRAVGLFGKGLKFVTDGVSKFATKIGQLIEKLGINAIQKFFGIKTQKAVLDSGDAAARAAGGFAQTDAAAKKAVDQLQRWNKFRANDGVPKFLKSVDRQLGVVRTGVSGVESRLSEINGKTYTARIQLSTIIAPTPESPKFSGPGIDPITGKSLLNTPAFLAAQQAALQLQNLNTPGGTGDTPFQTRVKAIVAKLQETLDEARERIRNASESFRDSVGLSFGLVTSGFRARFSTNKVIAQMKRIKDAIGTFSKDIIELRRQGADAALIDELIGLGPLGGAAAARDLLSSGSLNEFLGLRKDLASSGAAVGAAGNIAITGTSTSGLTNAINNLNRTVAAGKGNTYNIQIANPNITPQQIIAQIKAYEKKTGKKVFSN
jgi:hypothetical protein